MCTPARSRRRCATASPSAARSPPATGSRSTRDGICVATKSAADAAIALLDELIDDDSELVTVVVGADADAADTARIAEHLGLAHPDVELELHDGDQPLYPYLVGVE